ncbi:cobyrinate a,c-diamide synthase [Phormidium sp. FACHB-592]|uniref:Cobyrinate a,c-diamide synthase n=1 Tax=Stenomitos frigidus AS-A4 TaxID=2933935 RepID=A0ABV0KLL9_9CYAN|nr:cobyrinate a,c-diamide synthase [Phormidium sp. FACHB-592]MBD2075089.1 cobyrinate a,c-diamide synthase [Phormidium sp. FACHB-592]
MALIVAGERSGVGKTTVTLALLSALKRRNVSVQSFKVGPDYIDPMFHRYVTGRACRNLDPMLTSEAYVQQCFDHHAQTATHALVEGVMGLFDGAAGQEGFASTAHVARLLDLPILLVLNCGGLSHSIAAIVHGYRSFDPRLQVAGIVLNRVGSDRHLEILKAALEPLNIPILGVLRREDGITIPDRHLGLVPTAELENLNTVVEQLAHLGDTCFDWAQLMPLLEQRSAISGQRLELTPPLPPYSSLPPPPPSPRIAIAHDSAFSFYYADNLDLLKALGAELVFWSPMRDRVLPDNIQGLYFGGGFPEVFAEQLAENESACAAVRSAIRDGMPTYAECGGLMYLCEKITNFEGQAFPMVGVLPTTAMMGKRLTLGYRDAIALQDGLLLDKGSTIRGHEFHRSHLTLESHSPLFALHSPHSSLPNEGWHYPNLHASYLHLHWGARPEIPQRFLERCAASAVLSSA